MASQLPPQLASVGKKIERAEHHLRDLETITQGFLESNPYDLRIQDNSQTGRRETVVTRADELPGSIAVVAGDAIHNLRSVLDHLIYRLTVENGGKSDNDAMFPIWNTKASHKAARPGYAHGISKTALDIFYALKPYKGGNSALWTLHRLDIIDKHRLMLATPTANHSVILEFDPKKMFGALPVPEGHPGSDEIPTQSLRVGVAEPDVMKVGAVLFHAPLGDDFGDNTTFVVSVALNEPGIVKLEPLVPLLNQLASAVRGTVDLFLGEFA
jgi:hypothetical protein